uniref:Uncharacterized protein n=1 Tax=viral metagenome TaxID=1070528 RepID=A0A6C0C9I4_9ZZZZ
MEISDIKNLLIEIRTKIDIYFAEIYHIDSEPDYSTANDNYYLQGPSIVSQITSQTHRIKNETITDYFTHFQNSGIHAMIESIIAISHKLDNNDVTEAVAILEGNYLAWKNLFCERTYHVRSSKVLGSTSGFLVGAGLLVGSSIIATGGIVGICGSICLYAWKYGLDSKDEKSSFNKFYEAVKHVVKKVNKVEERMFLQNHFRHSFGQKNRADDEALIVSNYPPNAFRMAPRIIDYPDRFVPTERTTYHNSQNDVNELPNYNDIHLMQLPDGSLVSTELFEEPSEDDLDRFVNLATSGR